MRVPLLLCCLAALTPVLRGQSPAPTTADLTTLRGKTYHHARVFRVEPDGITYMYDGGMSKIDFTDLPEVIRKQYGFDPAKAAAFAAEDDDVQNRTYWASQAQAQEIARKNQAALETQGRQAVKAKGSDFTGNSLDAGREGGLQHFATLTVSQIVARSFSLKGTMIEMTGIDKIEPKEISAGVYQLTIWAKGSTDFLRATLPATRARGIESAKSLIVAVKTPDSNVPEIVILGNATEHEGLSTIPVAVWK